MNKRALLQIFAEQISESLNVLTQAAKNAHEAATHAESKAEDQYDTRGLEAAYLAGAQSKRAAELEGLLALFRHVDVKTFGPGVPIASTAVVHLELDGNATYCLIMPKGGGLSALVDGNRVQVITPQSPLGEALLGRLPGDQVQVEIQRAKKDYDIIAAW